MVNISPRASLPGSFDLCGTTLFGSELLWVAIECALIGAVSIVQVNSCPAFQTIFASDRAANRWISGDDISLRRVSPISIGLTSSVFAFFRCAVTGAQEIHSASSGGARPRTLMVHSPASALMSPVFSCASTVGGISHKCVVLRPEPPPRTRLENV